MKSASRVSIQAIFILCAFLGLSQSGHTYGDDFNSGWSLDYVVEPSQVSISGVSLIEIDSELTHIEFINCQHQSLSIEQCNQIDELGGELELSLDMNGDGQAEIWRIAVAKLMSGDYAKVLVIQDANTSKVIQTLIVESYEPGFSALYFHRGKVMWGMCLSCDVLADIEWKDGSYHILWQPHLDRSHDMNWDEGAIANYL